MPKSMGPGDVLAGRYRLVDLMSEARGGRFWYAHDTVLDRKVALHVIPEVDERAGELMDAARRSATLHDPRLLRVLDADTLEGNCFVVNEWGEGTSLDVMLNDQPLAPRRAAWIVSEVGQLITYTHEAGVAHGRLAPENVLVDESGAVKVIGFAVDAALHGLPVGRPEDDLTDLAGVLYAALTGKWPGRSSSGTVAAPRENGRPLRPRKVRAGVPRALDTICDEVLGCTAGHDSHGYTSARAVVEALNGFIGDPGVVAEEEVRRQREDHAHPSTPRHPRPGRVGQPAAPSGFPDTPPQDTPDGEPGQDAEPDQGTAEGPAQETQVGAPVFYDEIDDVGWATPSGTTPPPPPPFEEPAERPLFAPDPPGGRRPRPGPDLDPGTNGSGTSGGTAGGTSDGFWPWGAEGGPAFVEDQPDEPVPGRSWMRVAAAIAVALVILVATIYAFNRGTDGTPPFSDEPDDAPGTSATAEPQAVEIAEAGDFDPLADPPEENPELAVNVIDGDPATTWRTSTYRQDLGPAGLKEGVGLMLDLGEEYDVREVTVTLVGSPTELQVLTSAGDQEPTEVDQLDVVAEQRATGTTVTLAPEEPATARWVVIWLTALPPVDGGFRGQVAQVVVRA